MPKQGREKKGRAVAYHEAGGRDRLSFPNMTSLIRHAVWRDGLSRISAEAQNIPGQKARAAARLLLRQGLVMITEEDGLLVLRPVRGSELDREIYPEPPDDVEAWA